RVLQARGAGPWFLRINGATATVDLFDPSLNYAGGWGQTTYLNRARSNHAACLLGDGKVLVTGGIDDRRFALDDAEIYDPVAQTWTFVAHPMNEARENHQCALLPDGKVLVAGGDAPGQVEGPSFRTLDSAEVFDPSNETWTYVGSMNTPR